MIVADVNSDINLHELWKNDRSDCNSGSDLTLLVAVGVESIGTIKMARIRLEFVDHIWINKLLLRTLHSLILGLNQLLDNAFVRNLGLNVSVPVVLWFFGRVPNIIALISILDFIFGCSFFNLVDFFTFQPLQLLILSIFQVLLWVLENVWRILCHGSNIFLDQRLSRLLFSC